jgi:DNA-binding response OmpR family regulator
MDEKRVLLLEDEPGLSFAIKLLLEQNGFVVHAFDTLESFLENYRFLKPYDLLILDVTLPDGDLIETVQVFPDILENTKAIIISADVSIQNIRRAFKVGATDFIKKPFDPEELLIRIDRLFEKNRIIEFGDGLRFDRVDNILYDKNQIIHLTPNEERLLKLLLQNRKRYVSTELIGMEVWGDDSVSANSVAALVRRLRKKVGKNTIAYTKYKGYMIP